MTVTYRDYRKPLREAGAKQDSRGRWRSPDGILHFCAQDCAEHMGVHWSAEPPKTRSFAAIRRANMAEVSRRLSKPSRTGREAAATRAFQYAMALHGIDTPHSAVLPHTLDKACDWDRAADGVDRIRAVRTDLGVIEIPHWDFSPEMLPS